MPDKSTDQSRYCVTGCNPQGERRIIYDDCTLEEAHKFIECLPAYIEPLIEMDCEEMHEQFDPQRDGWVGKDGRP